MNIDEFTDDEELLGRAGLYGLLARLWIRECDQQCLQELAAAGCRERFLSAGGALPAAFDAATLSNLQADYCQLFVGPRGHVPPVQSVWHSGRFQAAPFASMQSFIDVIGYDKTRIPSGLMLDHLGVQLDVMSDLLRRIASIRSSGDPARQDSQLSESVNIAVEFFVRHLEWTDVLFERCRERAETDFYRSMIGMTQSFLHSESIVMQRGIAP